MSNKISIITITKNNRSGLKRTLDSIECQTRRNFELIVVDGQSNDGTDQLFRQHSELIHCVLKDKGTGIYAAMNQGIQEASGEWLIFMNAGDCFYNGKVFENFKPNSSAKIIHGIALKQDRTKHLPYDESLPFWKRMPISHQATFFHKSIMAQRSYDETFKIVADFEYLMWAKTNGILFQHLDLNVAIIEAGGISEVKVIKRVWETYRAAVKYFPKFKVHRFYISKLWWALKKELYLKLAT